MADEKKLMDLKGMDVVTSDGRELGDVRDFTLDLEGWTVTHVHVRAKRQLLDELKLERPLLGSQTVRIPIEYIGGVGDKFVLTCSVTDLAGDVLETDEEPEDEEKA